MASQLIAEIGQAHDGSLGMAHAFIDAIASAGAQVAKFQMHLAHAESSQWEPFRTPFSYEDTTRQEYWRRMEFTETQWAGLRDHCAEKGIECLITPFSLAAVECIERLGLSRYKLGSADLGNSLLLDCVARTRKPIVLSSGMSNWSELDQAVARVKRVHDAISILQCTTAYPCPPEAWGLHCIPAIASRYGFPVGYSDHSGSIHAGIAARALGAKIIEVHACFDRRMFGPDAKASLTIDELTELRKGLDMLDRADAPCQDKPSAPDAENLKQVFGRSLATNKNLQSGHTINFEDLEAKKPAGRGIPVSECESVLGRTLRRDLAAWEFIQWDDLDGE
ncbi:MAG: N-acetylneuraminate synthase family protein [Saprospiraceae bacterium]|nr:N-acetylneuraminate synthase family protein [Saprospiraceae bacterium]